jgi:inner membrane protein
VRSRQPDFQPDFVDNLCHSLVGAALSGAGFRRRTGLATATMIIGANLPDVDAIVYVLRGGASALAFRRGWTHGILAMVVLPILLTGIMLWVGLARDARRARKRRPVGTRVVPSQLLLVAAISIWTHPLFDLFNTYGVRLLMPFSSRWFYGDTLFIVDPWIWLALGVGAFISIRRALAVPVGAASPKVMARVHRPARVAVFSVAAYIAVMAASSWIGRVIVERQAVAAGGPVAERVMVAPDPVTPFTRSVIRDVGRSYELGRLTWWPSPRYAASSERLPEPPTLVDSAARANPDGRRFLSWARFPFVTDVTTGDSAAVRLDDARYARTGQHSFANVTVPMASR